LFFSHKYRHSNTMNRWAPLTALLLTLLAAAAPAQTLDWVRQFGGPANDLAVGIDVDVAGNLFVVGSLQSETSNSHFFGKYGNDGELAWSRDLQAIGGGIAVDLAGSVFVAGAVEISSDNYDGYLGKHDADGELLWERQLGSVDHRHDSIAQILPDEAGNLYFTGSTAGLVSGSTGETGLSRDALVGKYDALGNLSWVRQLHGNHGNGDCMDRGNALAVDATGAVYVAGFTGCVLGSTNYGSTDAFVAKYDANGSRLWVQQFGSSEPDSALGIALDNEGGVLIAGSTFGVLGGVTQGDPPGEGFLIRFDGNGNESWKKQFGDSTSPSVRFNHLHVDDAGDIFVLGATYSDTTTPRNEEVLLRKHDPSGNEIWSIQLGTDEDDRVSAMAFADGVMYFAGNTYGDWGGPNSGGSDAYLARYSVDVDMPGDTNGDGLVDLEDLNNVRNHFGGTGLGDTNADGVVDLADLNAVRNNFGASAGAVPEPSAALLFSLGALALGTWHAAQLAARKRLEQTN
jgi:hypothetical protein